MCLTWRSDLKILFFRSDLNLMNVWEICSLIFRMRFKIFLLFASSTTKIVAILDKIIWLFLKKLSSPGSLFDLSLLLTLVAHITMVKGVIESSTWSLRWSSCYLFVFERSSYKIYIFEKWSSKWHFYIIISHTIVFW